MITPPTKPLYEPAEGFARHQYILAFTRQDFDRLAETGGLTPTLIEYFGIPGAVMAEKVRNDGDWVAYHLWVDQGITA